MCLYDECRPMSINGYCSIVYTLLKVVWCRTGQLLRQCCGILLKNNDFIIHAASFIFDVS